MGRIGGLGGAWTCVIREEVEDVVSSVEAGSESVGCKGGCRQAMAVWCWHLRSILGLHLRQTCKSSTYLPDVAALRCPLEKLFLLTNVVLFMP